MADKYQVLVSGSDKHSIIEKTTTPSGKEVWNVYIPDSGDRNKSSRVARLLNTEHQQLIESREARQVEEDEAAERAKNIHGRSSARGI